MKYIFIALLTSLLPIISPPTCNAQPIKFQTLNNLNMSGANCFTQDSIGFIWIGYDSGFSRYDGYELKTFNIENLKDLPTNSIKSIAYDKYNNILLGTPIGLFAYKPNTNILSPISLESNQLTYINDIITVDTISYVASNIGLHKLVNTKSIEYISKYIDDSNNKNLLGEVTHIAKSSNGDIFISNKKGIYVLNKKLDLPKLIYESQEIINIECTSINNNSTTIIAYNGYEVSLIDFNSNYEFIKETIISYKDQAISNVSDITIDSSNNIWIGTYGEGLFKINNSGNIESYYHNTQNHNSISNNYIKKIFTDRDNNILLSTDANINIIQSKSAFNELSIIDNHKIENVHAIHKENSNTILIGTKGNGLYIIDELTKSVNSINNKQFNTIRCFLKCRNGDLYIGTGGQGLLKARIDTLKNNIEVIEAYTHSKVKTSISDNYIYTLKEDKNGNIWIGTNNGLSKLIQSERIKKEKRFLNYYHNSENSNSVRSNIIYSLFIDSFNNIWYGTLYNGFGKIQQKEIPEENSYEVLKDYSLIFLNFHTKMHSNSISLSGYTFTEDKDKNIWIGTDNGLIFKKYNSTDYKYYTTSDGLSNNSIYTCYIDNLETLWLSTSAGINSINLKDSTIRRFSKEDGLQSNEFNGNAYFITDDNILYIGGSKGVNIINTTQFDNIITENVVAISNIRIDNKIISTTNSSSIYKEISYLDTLILNHNNNTLDISLSSLNYTNPTKTRYKYQLQGNSNEWIDNGLNNVIHLNLLHPGKYTLNISCTNSAGEWISSSKSLYIIIRTPIYKSIAAKILYFLLAIFITRYIWNERRERKELIRAVKNNHTKNTEIEETLVFFTNILHELKSSLSLVINPLESVLKIGSLNYKYQQKLSLTYKNSKRLSTLIDEAISVRKLEKNQNLSLKLENININNFIEAIVSSYIDYAQSKSLEIIFIPSINEINSFVDPSKLDKIICNLITNAIKFTKKGGNIIVQVKSDKEDNSNNLSIIVKDNGIGIKKEDLPKICNRFYQVENNIGGNGIGLHLTKHYAQLHGGNLFIESEIGKGSTFTISIPIKLLESYNIGENKIEEDILQHHKLENSVKEHTKPAITHKDNPYTMLIIDDSIELLNYIKSRFNKKFNVIVADNGKDGLAMAIKHKPEIVITDIVIPEPNGIELCKAIKGNSIISNTYIIVLSATDSDKERKSALNAGGDIFISKPFSDEYLISVVDLFIKNLNKDSNTTISNETNLVYDNKITSISSQIAITSSEKIFIERFNKYIQENIMNEDLSVEIFAESMKMSRSNFYRIIKKITGKSPNAIILWTRMAIAADLLVLNTLSVSEISYKVGFADPKYFTKVFKKHYGKTPSEYAQQFNNSSN